MCINTHTQHAEAGKRRKAEKKMKERETGSSAWKGLKKYKKLCAGQEKKRGEQAHLKERKSEGRRMKMFSKSLGGRPCPFSGLAEKNDEKKSSRKNWSGRDVNANLKGEPGIRGGRTGGGEEREWQVTVKERERTLRSSCWELSSTHRKKEQVRCLEMGPWAGTG